MLAESFLKKHFWKIVFIGLLIIVSFLLIWLIRDLRSLYRAGDLRPTRGWNRNYMYGESMTPGDIKEWMTFSYVDYIFKLPPDYLSTSLGIKNSHYPNLQINQYAKESGLDSVDLLNKVKTYVSDYIKSVQ